EQPAVDTLGDAVAEAAPLQVAGGPNRFMSKVDVTLNPRPPKEKPSADSNQQSADSGHSETDR
ncbi:MAG: hypothetical protein ACREEV_10305, partial [Dongiaceae bacterium]